MPSQRHPRHPHSLSQFTGPRRFEHCGSSRKKRQDAPCNLALISATGFLVTFASISDRFRDHKKNDHFPDNLNKRYSTVLRVMYPLSLNLAPCLHPFFLHLGPDIVEFARVVRHERQVELTFPAKPDPRRARRSSRRLRARQDYSVKVLADQFQSSQGPLRSNGL